MNLRQWIDEENEIWISSYNVFRELGFGNWQISRSGAIYLYCGCNCTEKASFRQRCSDISKEISNYKVRSASAISRLENLWLTHLAIDEIDIGSMTEDDKKYILDKMRSILYYYNRIKTLSVYREIGGVGFNFFDLPIDYATKNPLPSLKKTPEEIRQHPDQIPYKMPEYIDYLRSSTFNREHQLIKKLNYENRWDKLIEIQTKVENIQPKPEYLINNYVPRTTTTETTTTSQSNPLIALLGLGLLLNMG